MAINQNEILLIIVNYNQSLEIPSFLEDLKKYWPLEKIIFVDDGSTDGSLDIVRTYGITYIAHGTNQGVGAAIRSGIMYARRANYKAVLIMSSNGKMLAEEIPKVVDPIIQSEANYVTGSRFLVGVRSPGLSMFRRFSIPVFSFLSTVLLGRKFSDITCGFRCYEIDFLFRKPCDISQDWLSRYELEYYIHFWACRRGLKIREVPVTIKYDHLDKNRKSKIRPFVDWWSMLRPLIYLRLGVRR